MVIAKKQILSLLLTLLFCIVVVFSAERAVKIDDTFYAGRLGYEHVSIKGLDKTDKIDFLVGDSGYHLSVVRISPEVIEFKLDETGEIITVNIRQESSLNLADSSKLNIKFIEHERADSDIEIWADLVGGIQSEEEQEVVENNVEEESQTTDVAAQTLNESSEERITENEEFYIKIKNWLWISLIVIFVLIVLILSITYFKKNPPKVED